MKKALTSALVLTFAVVLSFVLVTGTQAESSLTIFETLRDQDGAQGFIAVVRLAEERCPRFSRLLDRARASLVVLVPNNAAFEEFLNLPLGALVGQDIDFIEAALPGYLTRVNLNIRDLCRLLRRHISKSQVKTVQELLERGFITMIDGSEQPVAIGRGGVTVAYQAPVTERDVFTVNGVIHYIDNVLVEPPPPSEDTSPLPLGFCDAPLNCGMQTDECKTFVAACNASMQDREDCVQGATLICIDIF